MSAVTKTAEDRNTGYQPAYFYRSAREGMGQVLEYSASRDARGVLLPGYIGWSPHEGSGVFDPVGPSGLDAGFYDLDNDLSPNLDDVEAHAKTGKFGVLVVIHYFGRVVKSMAELRQVADRYGMLLVEDLAHGFFTAFTGHVAGRHGDVNLYSLHKMFPVSEGGMVTYANKEHAVLASSTLPEVAGTILGYDWSEIAQRRRANFLGFAERLSALAERGVDFELMWPTLADGEVPQSLPLYVIGDHRDDVYRVMNERGYGLVSLYHTLIPEVRGVFPLLDDLSRHITNLPCHQDVSEGSLDGMVEAFRLSLRKA